MDNTSKLALYGNHSRHIMILNPIFQLPLYLHLTNIMQQYKVFYIAMKTLKHEEKKIAPYSKDLPKYTNSLTILLFSIAKTFHSFQLLITKLLKTITNFTKVSSSINILNI